MGYVVVLKHLGKEVGVHKNKQKIALILETVAHPLIHYNRLPEIKPYTNVRFLLQLCCCESNREKNSKYL